MRILAIGLLFVASSAAADAPNAPVRQAAPPPSVWQSPMWGDMEHLQSGLLCPSHFGDYHRDSAMVFDAFGLDVGCDYRTRNSAITLYLTRRSGSGLDAALAEAESEVMKFGAAKHPQALGRTRLTAAGLDWTTTLYAEDGGLRSSIWLADLNGWTLEYRATYAIAQAARVRADLEQMTANVESSAGAHLALCARSAVPARDGLIVTDAAEISSAALTTSLDGGGAMAAAHDGKARREPAPVWCADQPVARDGFHLLFWRAVDAATGADAHADRITIIDNTARPAPVLQVAADSLGDLANNARGRGDGKPQRWAATITTPEHVLILGYFHGRPSAVTVASLYSDILTGKAKAVGSYSASGKDIVINVPADN